VKRLAMSLSVILVLTKLLAACGPAPTPEVVTEIQEVEVTRVVEKEGKVVEPAPEEAHPKGTGVWSEPVNIGERQMINTTAPEFAPRLSEDMLTMFFVSRDRPDGYGGADIWMSTRDSIDAPWSEPVNLGPLVNTEYDELFACPSPDMLTLYFTSTGDDGYGGEDLYVSTRDSVDASWGEPENLGPSINTEYGECQACPYSDMLTLYFASDRPGGHGGGDIWMSTRDSTEAPWSEPVNLDPPVNTEYEEWNPSISSDRLALFFDSDDRPGGCGESDIWMSIRDSTDVPWGEPVNLGPPINTEYGEYTPWVCSDGVTLYFDSDRPEGRGGDDLWITSLEPER
jgi:hypothetical protein